MSAKASMQDDPYDERLSFWDGPPDTPYSHGQPLVPEGDLFGYTQTPQIQINASSSPPTTYTPSFPSTANTGGSSAIPVTPQAQSRKQERPQTGRVPWGWPHTRTNNDASAGYTGAVPPPPRPTYRRPCARCKELKIKCTFPCTNALTCLGCLASNVPPNLPCCTVEGRKPKTPSQREASLREERAAIARLIRQQWGREEIGGGGGAFGDGVPLPGFSFLGAGMPLPIATSHVATSLPNTNAIPPLSTGTSPTLWLTALMSAEKSTGPGGASGSGSGKKGLWAAVREGKGWAGAGWGAGGEDSDEERISGEESVEVDSAWDEGVERRWGEVVGRWRGELDPPASPSSPANTNDALIYESLSPAESVRHNRHASKLLMPQVFVDPPSGDPASGDPVKNSDNAVIELRNCIGLQPLSTLSASDDGYPHPKWFTDIIGRTVSMTKGRYTWVPTGDITIIKGPVCGGRYCDIYIGELKRPGRGGTTRVALKQLRTFVNASDRMRKMFCREVKFWSGLRHPNVSPFWGCWELDEYRLFMVSPWASNGNAMQYVKKYPDADRRRILFQTAEALAYLHSGLDGRAVVHGDLKADNVLISPSGDALLADFGLARYVEKWTSASSATPSGISTHGHIRFSAPELLLPETEEEGRPTPQSDVFAFGCLIIQIFTEKLPFAEIKVDPQVITHIVRGKIPRRPIGPAEERGLDDFIWMVSQECWQLEPTKRPSMGDVALRLRPGRPPYIVF